MVQVLAYRGVSASSPVIATAGALSTTVARALSRTRGFAKLVP